MGVDTNSKEYLFIKEKKIGKHFQVILYFYLS